MKRPSLTLILSGVFLAYIAHSMWTIYGLFSPAPCPKDAQCLSSILVHKPRLKLWVYTSAQSSLDHNSKKTLIWEKDALDISDTTEMVVNVSIPKKTRNNGTLYSHVFLTQNGAQPFSNRFDSYGSSLMTTYTIPQAQAFNLMGENNDNTTSKATRRDKTLSHWQPKLIISVMEDLLTFDRMNVPGEVHRFMKINYEGEYMPILYIDTLSSRIRDLIPINDTSRELPLTITYRPISVGKLRLWVNMEESMKTLKTFGFTEKDTDEMKGIFADTNFYLLMLTFTVAAFHLLFDFLAFKNDITYWKNRNTMIGLSSRTVVWRCVSTIIIFFYLMDEETSLIVLVPAGIGALIEAWKVTKAFKITVTWNGIRPSFMFGNTSAAEKETQQFDSQAMKYLSYILYPLCFGGAVYSLIYTPHKSWISWCIQSLVNGVYAFGFLFMLPQLFVNYKLKSVAHLPWRAFMYKAFNTFIDDVFAFIITMPTAHRLACFRDDIVFLFYLYQRWLYPVDKTRVNEYGQSFETEGKDSETKKTK